MDNISFDDMIDLLKGDLHADTEATNNYNDELAAVNDAISAMQIVTPKPSEVIGPTTISVEKFDAECNTLIGSVQESFKRDIMLPNNKLFTAPTPTTFTMDGFMANVRFHEEEFIKILEPTENVVMLDCNFGKKIHPSYREPVAVKKNNRGRKKKLKQPKTRKIQGNGKCFSSQITFVVRAGLNKDGSPVNRPSTAALIEHYSAPGAAVIHEPVYKFKLFRNGRIQLPGAKPALINDIIDKISFVENMLNSYLHADEMNIFNKTSVVNINPVMKNYKFLLLMEADQIIDLMLLKTTLVEHKFQSKSTPTYPQIIDINYNRSVAKISVTFLTPIYKDALKTTKLNIFMRGKINILGAYHSHVAQQICEFLYYLFDTYPDLITDTLSANTAVLHIEPVQINIDDELRLASEITSEYMASISADQLASMNNILGGLFLY